MAEYLRREGYMDLERLLELRARIWVLRVQEPHVTVINFDNATDSGLEPGDLVADDYGACQAFAERCRSEDHGPTAIKVPSAALPGTHNLVIFGARALSPYDSIPIDQIDVPGSVVAEGSRSLHTLVDRVRYIGRPHPQLESWKRGVEWEFEEPSREMLNTSL